MNVSRAFKFISLTSVLSLIIACGGHQYQNNASLEQPPTLKIEQSINSPAVTETNINTGLNDAVTLMGTNRLHLKQSYEQAWSILATALEFNGIEISDRNQETGEYFINYDPDNTRGKNTGLLDDVSFFLFKDDYAKAAYKITLTQVSQAVEIRAEKLAAIEMDLLDDGEDIIFDDNVDDGRDKLIRYLYKTLKNDLPLD
jgi:hypothetical protein